MSLPFSFLDKRPIIVALAGSNGAGKSTFYESYLSDAGLRFINADELSASLGLSPYEAAELATLVRRELVNQQECFIFETVLSDPVGEKVDQLTSYAALEYTVVLIFIRIESANEASCLEVRRAIDLHGVPPASATSSIELVYIVLVNRSTLLGGATLNSISKNNIKEFSIINLADQLIDVCVVSLVE
ncbi:hypothetical protein SH501x_003310 [Pirellulaceae bacterium SH501]